MLRDEHDPRVLSVQLDSMTRCLRPVSAAEATRQASEDAALRRMRRRHRRNCEISLVLAEEQDRSRCLSEHLDKDFRQAAEQHSNFLEKFRQRSLSLDMRFKEKGIFVAALLQNRCSQSSVTGATSGVLSPAGTLRRRWEQAKRLTDIVFATHGEEQSFSERDDDAKSLPRVTDGATIIDTSSVCSGPSCVKHTKQVSSLIMTTEEIRAKVEKRIATQSLEDLLREIRNRRHDTASSLPAQRSDGSGNIFATEETLADHQGGAKAFLFPPCPLLSGLGETARETAHAAGELLSPSGRSSCTQVTGASDDLPLHQVNFGSAVISSPASAAVLMDDAEDGSQYTKDPQGDDRSAIKDAEAPRALCPDVQGDAVMVHHWRKQRHLQQQQRIADNMRSFSTMPETAEGLIDLDRNLIALHEVRSHVARCANEETTAVSPSRSFLQDGTEMNNFTSPLNVNQLSDIFSAEGRKKIENGEDCGGTSCQSHSTVDGGGVTSPSSPIVYLSPAAHGGLERGWFDAAVVRSTPRFFVGSLRPRHCVSWEGVDEAVVSAQTSHERHRKAFCSPLSARCSSSLTPVPTGRALLGDFARSPGH
jgi:hypothetical protein